MLDLDLATILSNIIILVIAFSVHEFSHAWTADLFGDLTPRYQGRLTLNPLVHIDPMGALLLVVAGFGWARPVEIDPYALQRRSPAAPMIVALAGPLSNLLLAIAVAVPFRMGLLAVSFPSGTLPSIEMLATQFVYINLVLFFFNLLPIAPLDGDKIVTYFMPRSFASTWEQIRRYGPIILLLVVFLGPSLGFDLLGTILGPPLGNLFWLLVG